MPNPAVDVRTRRGHNEPGWAVSAVRAAAAEWSKAVSLRIVPTTLIGSILVAALLGMLYTLSAITDPITGVRTAQSLTSAELVTAALGAMMFLQIGPLLLGVFVVVPDYASPVIRTTLLAVPQRTILFGAKLLVATVLVALGAVASLVGLFGGATIAAALMFEDTPPLAEFFHGETLQVLAGAWLYLTLIGLLAFGSTLAVRQLIPALIGLLSLVIIVSPLLSAAPKIAKWMPDTAGSQLYLREASGDPSLGGLVLTAWALVAIITGGLLLIRRDA